MPESYEFKVFDDNMKRQFLLNQILEQEDVDQHVVMSSCLNSMECLKEVYATFGKKISYNYIAEALPVNVTFNKTVQECIKKFGKFDGYLYVASDVSFEPSKKIITSPVDGYVFDLKPLSKGYSAQMTEILLKIVPLGDLIAYLEIPSSDIGFVKKGMEVEISIDSYPATDFGVIDGNITSIGTDALEPDPSEQRNQFVYPARIELKSQKLKLKRGKNLDLKVGMSLQGNIKLRKVSYLQLLFTNFKDKTKSIKEL